MPRGVLDLGDLQRRLDELARRRDPRARIEGLGRIEKGLSTLTFSADLVTGDRVEPMIVKVAPPGLAPTANRDVLRQARLYRALGRHAIPVPEVLLDDGGAPPEVPPLFAMSRIPGDTVDPTWPGDPALDDGIVRRRGIAMAEELGRLHRVPAEALGEAPLGLVDEVERWTAAFATVDPDLAAIAARLRERLLASLPEAMPPVINHGDYRYGNVLFEGAEITGLIDWEIAAVQDPRFDLANLIVYCGVHSPLRLREDVYAHEPEELVAPYEESFGGEMADLDWFVLALRYKCAGALALLFKRNARLPEPDPLMVRVGEGLAPFLAEA